MTKQEKIDAIYKEIANKELSFGCKVKTNFITRPIAIVFGKEECEDDDGVYYEYILGDKEDEEYDTTNIYEEDIKEKIGHPVMIGDVLDYKSKEIKSNKGQHHGHELQYLCKNLTTLWQDLRKPIEEQSDNCIDYIYNLITND